jgi:hypothetical protein
MTDHKATPEQWAMLEERSAPEYDNTILELRARVEALEAAQQQPEPIDEEENDRRFHACMDLIKNATPEQIRAAARLPEQGNPVEIDGIAPASSLVKRVALAISGIEYGLERDEEAVNWAPEARAAIREVAAWLREAHGWEQGAQALEREAGQ